MPSKLNEEVTSAFPVSEAIGELKPGAYAMADGLKRAPHINMVLVFSGLMRQLQTVVFFEGEPGNATDPVLAAVQRPAALANWASRPARPRGRPFRRGR